MGTRTKADLEGDGASGVKVKHEASIHENLECKCPVESFNVGGGGSFLKHCGERALTRTLETLVSRA